MNIVLAKYKLHDLTESSQTNPIRYHILHRVDDTYTDQSGEFKCKDYMNDIVAKYQGININPYGMDFAKIKVNDEGVYLLLTKLKHVDNLQAGLSMISTQTEKDGYPALQTTPVKEGIVLFIDKAYFVSTYVISFLMSCVRLVHSETTYESVEQLVTTERKSYDAHGNSQDNPFGFYSKQMAKNMFKNPCISFTYLGPDKDDAYIRNFTQNYHTSFHGLGIQSVVGCLICNGVWK